MCGDAIRESDPPGPSPRRSCSELDRNRARALAIVNFEPNDNAVHATTVRYRVNLVTSTNPRGAITNTLYATVEHESAR
jgi:hypothetical protein